MRVRVSSSKKRESWLGPEPEHREEGAVSFDLRCSGERGPRSVPPQLQLRL